MARQCSFCLPFPVLIRRVSHSHSLQGASITDSLQTPIYILLLLFAHIVSHSPSNLRLPGLCFTQLTLFFFPHELMICSTSSLLLKMRHCAAPHRHRLPTAMPVCRYANESRCVNECHNLDVNFFVLLIIIHLMMNKVMGVKRKG